MWSFTDHEDGTFTINSAPAASAAPTLVNNSDGTFDLALEVVADGATVAVAASPVPGSATGGAETSGSTLASAASVIAGTAAGEAQDGDAPGAILTVATVLVPGVAVGRRRVVAGGWFRTASWEDRREEPEEQEERVDGWAHGARLFARARLVAGQAAGVALARGAAVRAEIVSEIGAAHGQAIAAGNVLPWATADVVAGNARGVDTVSDDNDFLMMLAA